MTAMATTTAKTSWQNNNFARACAGNFFVYFSTVVARLRRETS